MFGAVTRAARRLRTHRQGSRQRFSYRKYDHEKVRRQGWWNGGDQRLATKGPAIPPGFIASPAASRCSGRTIYSERPSITRSRKSTRALGSHANTDRPPLDEVATVDEGDDRFTSGGPANTACYRRLDSTPTSLRPESWFAISLPARPSNPAAISISIFSRVETARSRKRGDRFTPSGRENAQNDKDQRLASLGAPSGPTLSRVRCIALLCTFAVRHRLQLEHTCDRCCFREPACL